jgi:hypothetical protein
MSTDAEYDDLPDPVKDAITEWVAALREADELAANVLDAASENGSAKRMSAPWHAASSPTHFPMGASAPMNTIRLPARLTPYRPVRQGEDETNQPAPRQACQPR